MQLMKEILDFYLRLSQNNNKPWFDEHGSEYDAITEKFRSLAAEMIDGVSKWDDCCKGLQVKDCV